MLPTAAGEQAQVQWFTTMVGKKATMRRARALLHAQRVPAVRTTEFVQGRTSRWGLAWSFFRGSHSVAQPLRPPALDMPLLPKCVFLTPGAMLLSWMLTCKGGRQCL
jgi:hypothetical protein